MASIGAELTLAVVASLGDLTFNTGLYAFEYEDSLGDGEPLLGFGRTLGVVGGVVRFGPLSVVSAHDPGRIVLIGNDGVAVRQGDMATDSDGLPPSISVGSLVGLFDLVQAMTWLPHAFAFDGDGVPREPRTGAPAGAGVED